MKYLHPFLAGVALVALAIVPAYAGSVSASTSTSTTVTGGTYTTGNASAVVVGVDNAVATSSAVSGPAGHSTNTLAVNNASTMSRSHTGFGGGEAAGHIAAGGNAFANAWAR